MLRVILLVLWLGPRLAEAQNLPADAAVFDEFTGTRSKAMGGAHRGVGTSNDTLYLNPAGMAVARRYSIELNYGYSPFSGLTHLNVSAVDSKSGPVAGGLGYTHTRGDDEGVRARLHRIYVGAAYALNDRVALGVTGRHIRGKFKDGGKKRDIELYTMDVGALAHFGGFGLGVTAHNIIKEEMKRMMPMTVGLGASYTAGSLLLAADFDFDTHEDDNTLTSYRIGGEYFIANQFPLRVGYYHAPFTNKHNKADSENVLTLGGAWVTPSGAVALSFDRSFDRQRNWSLAASLQFYL